MHFVPGREPGRADRGCSVHRWKEMQEDMKWVGHGTTLPSDVSPELLVLAIPPP